MEFDAVRWLEAAWNEFFVDSALGRVLVLGDLDFDPFCRMGDAVRWVCDVPIAQVVL